MSRNSSSLNLSGSVTFRENRAPYGGAISSSSNLQIAGSTRFVSNKADYMGGGIFLDSGQTLSLADNESFSGNKACSGGGGVFVSEYCTLLMTGGVAFTENMVDVLSFQNQNNCTECTSQGGAIYASDGTNLSIADGSLFIQNKVQGISGAFYGCGGAIYMSNGFVNSTLQVSGSVLFSENIAGGNGSTYDGILCGGQICATMGGGAICTDGSSVPAARILLLEGTSFQNNSAAFGGGISISYTDLTLLGYGDLSNNTAFGSHSAGGAIYAYASNVQVLGPVTFYGNKAMGNNAGGGAIFMDCSYCSSASGSASGSGIDTGLRLEAQTSFVANSAINSGACGGALYVEHRCCSDRTHSSNATYVSGKTSFIENIATLGGGAVYILEYSSSIYEFAGEVYFRSNYAGNEGGAIMTESSNIAGQLPRLIIRDNSSFVRNIAIQNGGAIAALMLFSLEISGNLIGSNNVALENGGFLYTEESVVLMDGNVRLVENHALTDGGAIFGTGQCSITINEGPELVQNWGQSGGAISIISGSVLQINGTVRLAANEADLSGGAISCSGAGTIANLKNGATLESNIAGTYGGAVFVEYAATLHTTDTTFSNNHALSGGGGIYVVSADAAVLLEGRCLLQENSASRGGALFLQ